VGVVSGDDARFLGDEAELFEEFGRELVRRIRARVNTSPELIEDACAFAWLQFMLYPPDRQRAWRAWLTTTAEREAWRLHRAEAGHVSLGVEGRGGDPADWLSPVDADGDRSDDHREAIEALEALASLPERRRRAKALHVAGLRYEEIAEELGVSRTRVDHLVKEANAALQEVRAHATGATAPRSERAARLQELEKDPPSWLQASIGRLRTSDGAQATLAWRRAALAIDDYRRLRGGVDLPSGSLDERPAEPRAARAFDLARRALERVHEIRGRGVER
jgi:RNA polymerase sigma factor (sigma-70 family)